MSYCNYLPIAAGTKRPALSSWEKFQKERFEGAIQKNAPRGIVCGGISDDLEVIDFDKHDGVMLLDSFIDRLELVKPGLISRLYGERTPRGGFHLYYRNENVESNSKLAYNEEGQAMIETRGAGGFIVCAPSPGYTVEYCGDSPDKPEDAPYITNEERAALLSVARSFDKRAASAGCKDTKTTRANSQEPTPADVLRLPIARETIKSALESAGFIFLYEKQEGAYYGHKDAENPADVKTLLSAEDNHVFCFASNNIGGLGACNTPLQVLAICLGMSEEEAAAATRQQYVEAFNAAPLPDRNEEEDEEEEEEAEEDDEELDARLYQNNKALFPAIVQRAVDCFALRTTAPQRSLYAVNFMALCGLLADSKVVVIDEEKQRKTTPRTALSVFNLADTGGGKDGVRARIKELFRQANEAAYYARGALEVVTESKKGKEKNKEGKEERKTLRPAVACVDRLTSRSALELKLGELATQDRRQRQKLGEFVESGAPLCLVVIDEAGDALHGGTQTTQLRAETYAAIKTFLSCSCTETIALNDGKEARREFKAAGYDGSMRGARLAALMFAPTGSEEGLKEADITGGFTNRFIFLYGERARAVCKVGAFLNHTPGAPTAQEQQVVEVIAAAEKFTIHVDKPIKDALTAYKIKLVDKAERAGKLQEDVARRLSSRVESFAVISAILRAVYNEETQQGQIDPAAPICLTERDVALTVVCLDFFYSCALRLVASGKDDTVDAKTERDRKVEQATIDAIKRSKFGLSEATLYRVSKYGLRRLGVSRQELRRVLNALTLAGVIAARCNKYYHKKG